MKLHGPIEGTRKNTDPLVNAINLKNEKKRTIYVCNVHFLVSQSQVFAMLHRPFLFTKEKFDALLVLPNILPIIQCFTQYFQSYNRHGFEISMRTYTLRRFIDSLKKYLPLWLLVYCRAETRKTYRAYWQMLTALSVMLFNFCLTKLPLHIVLRHDCRETSKLLATDRLALSNKGGVWRIWVSDGINTIG